MPDLTEEDDAFYKNADEYGNVYPTEDQLQLFDEIKDIAIEYRSTSRINVIRRKQLTATFDNLIMIWVDREYPRGLTVNHFSLIADKTGTRLINREIVQTIAACFLLVRGEHLIERTVNMPIRKSKDKN